MKHASACRFRISFLRAAVFLAACLLCCLGSRPTPLLAQPTGQVQVINALWLGTTVDVYVEGTLFVDDLAFQTAIPFSSLPAASLRVDVVAGTDPDDGNPLWTGNAAIQDGGTYVLALIQNQLGAVEGIIADNVRLASSSPATAEFFLIHSYPAAGSMDVTLRDLASFQVVGLLFNNFDVGDVGTYLSLGGGSSYLSFESSDQAVHYGAFEFDATPWLGQTFVLVASVDPPGATAAEFVYPVAFDVSGFSTVFPRRPVLNLSTIVFQVDMSREIRLGNLAAAEVVGVRGSDPPLSWNATTEMSDADGDSVYTASVQMSWDPQLPADDPENEVQYKFVHHPPGQEPGWEGSVGPGDSGNRTMNKVGDQTLPVVFWNNVTGVAKEDTAALPSTFALRGNYPNPFNPATRVVFDLSEAASVTVTVWDVLGRLVQTRTLGALPAGAGHSVAVEAAGWPSGVYVYRVAARTASGAMQLRTGRMLLAR